MKRTIAAIHGLLFLALTCFAVVPQGTPPASLNPMATSAPGVGGAASRPVPVDAWDALAALAIHRDPALLRGAASPGVRADDFNVTLKLARRNADLLASSNSSASQSWNHGIPFGPLRPRNASNTSGGGAPGAGIGTVSGRVADSAGSPIEGIAVMLEMDFAYPEGDTGCPSAPVDSYYSVTDAEGLYTVGFELAASYRAFAYDPEGRFFYEYYQDAPTWEEAAVLDLTEGQNLQGINFTLERAASIGGRVTDASTGQGVGNIMLSALPSDGSPDLWYGGYGASDADGNFVISSLPPGEYRVAASDPFVFYGEVSIPGTILLAAGQAVTGVQVQMAAVGSGITGTLTGSNGQPLEYAGLWAMGADYGYGGWGYTDAAGRYRIGLPAGAYYLQAWDYSGEFVGCYYPGTPLFEDALLLMVAENQVLSGIDFALPQAGKIAGSVRDGATGAPVPWAGVDVFSLDGAWVSSGYADETGVFTVGGLATGAYAIMATDWSMLYASQWYAGKADFGSADPVAVVQGQTHAGIDFLLARSGSIAGRVVDASTGAAVPYAMLMAWQGMGDPGRPDGAGMGYGYADEAGNFTIAGLTTGHYFLVAYDGEGAYLPTYFDGVTDPAQATPLAVANGEVTAGVVMRMRSGGRILGSVRGPTLGEPVPYAFVQAFDRDLNWMNFAMSDEAGRYAMSGLAGGSYYLQAYDSNGVLASQWYQNADAFAQATAVSVAEGATVAAVDFLLPPGGKISGTVRDSSGNPIPWMTLVAFQDQRTMFMEAYGYTDENGRYTIGGLSSGLYYVALYAWNGLVYYYPGTTDIDQAQRVQVTQGRETAGVDLALSTGGTITGTVTDQATGEPVPYAEVMVLDAMGMVVSWSMPDAVGQYLATWIPPGSYKAVAMGFEMDGLQCYEQEWYREKADFDSADWIRVAEDAEVSGIDFTLTLVEDCPRTWPPDGTTP